MRRFVLFFAWVFLAIAPAAQADFGFDDFGLSLMGSGGFTTTQAGSHPFAVSNRISFKTTIHPKYGEVPDGAVKNLDVALPAGLVGNPATVPRCSNADFFDIDPNTKLPNCANESAVGLISLKVSLGPEAPLSFITAPVYSLVPPAGMVQKLGFSADGIPVAVSFTLSPDPPYNVAISIANLSAVLPVYDSVLTIWGTPADPAHDSERGSCIRTIPLEEGEDHTTGEECPVDLPEVPFLTLPRTCSGPLEAGYEVASWANPGVAISSRVLMDDGATPPQPLRPTGCYKLDFSPTFAAQVTNGAVQSPTGLDLNLDVAGEGLTSPTGLPQSDIERAVVTLPEGMTVNASAAAGLGVCTPADYRRETFSSFPGAGCPDSSKIGSAEVVTPLLEEPLEGSLFVAQPDDPSTRTAAAENPFDSLLAIYIVVRNPNLGVIVKQPVKIEPDPVTGRLVATLGDLPQIPFSHFKLHFREGERSLLVTPASCGAYATQADLTPRSDPGRVLATKSVFQIAAGVGGGPCPPEGVRRPFAPALQAGTVTATAGAYKPFVLKASRAEGSQPIAAIQARLPAGVAARLAGIPDCSNAQIATAERGSGSLWKKSPSCPDASRVGTVNVGAGAGGAPLYLRGDAYLAGPYKGAPFSLAIVVPALVGPFDLGTAVVRVALDVDPVTAQIDAVSDAIPTILSGIPLNLRSLALNLDRPGFTVNPTNCKTMATMASATSILGQRVPLPSRFQVGACGSLGFKPRVSLRLLGPTQRGAHPRFRAVVRARQGDANISSAAIALPGSELLESRHIGQVCGPSRFDAGTCPDGSIYGYARAWTPLLDRPLAGPVYLRSSRGRLPDLVASLGGRMQLDLRAGLDSVDGRLRTTLQGLPDVPLSKVVLTMRGGEKGLLVNTGGVCRRELRGSGSFAAHSGKSHDTHPVVRTDCGEEGPKK
jgi:hypothetical protein